ncbi:hypothetical protein TR51_06485 [Kitasatospora griseola]|uniref:DNA (cytosine-5-)-methyltransferase n=1 Tax=Kitasatospora griseola TaxID=2064 RepID=A0A0D0PY59_KITGR|nr:hypothetical protein TR51_06485 [Kitasatospora griseola]
MDLFAGPGGWSAGLAPLGIADIGIEWDRHACATRAAAGHLTVRADVAQLATAPMHGRIRHLIASPPCQAWSRAGKQLGLVDQPLVHQAVHDLAHGRDTRASLLAACKDPRSLLAAEPMRYLHDLRPEDVVMEEVPDVLPLFKHFAEILRSWGYSTWCGILNAADYGVPQTRRRAILIASRSRPATAPAPTHDKDPADDLFGEALQPWVSMAAALGWGATDRPVPTVTAGGGKTGGAEPFPTQARNALAASRDRGDWILKSRRDSDTWIATDGPRENRSVDQPAVTLTGEAHRWAWTTSRPATTVCATDRIAPPGHRDRSSGGESQFANPDTVRITVAEAALLQSFPADYPWQGSKTKQFEQIGNAVPPLLAAHVCAAAFGLDLPDSHHTSLLATAA